MDIGGRTKRWANCPREGCRGERKATQGRFCPQGSTTVKDESPCQKGYYVVIEPYITVRERGVEPTLDRERTSLPLGVLHNSWAVRQGAWGR